MYITWNVSVWGLENRRFLKKILSKEAPKQAAEEWWKKYLQTLILNLWCNCATTLAPTYMASCTLSQNKNFLLRFSSFCGANIADEKNQPPPPLWYFGMPIIFLPLWIFKLLYVPAQRGGISHKLNHHLSRNQINSRDHWQTMGTANQTMIVIIERKRKCASLSLLIQIG